MTQFLADNTLPRLTDSPYDNPAVFTSTWAATMVLIEQAAAGGTGSSGLLAAFLKNGRISGIAPALPASPALGVKLPDGFQWVQNGELITVDGDTFVGDVPENFTGYASLTAAYDSESDTWSYALTTAETKPAAGSGILAKVVSNTTTVTSITTTSAESDVILTMPEIVAMLLAAGSGGSGGSTFIGDGQWLSTDTRATSVVIDEKFAAQKAELEDEINTGSSIKPMQQKTDILTQETAIIRQEVIALQPDTGERSASANIESSVDGTYGDGSDGRSDYLIDSTMTINDDGEFDA